MNRDMMRSGLGYMRLYGFKLLLFFACIILAASILLIRLCTSLPDQGSASLADLATVAVRYIVPFIPTLALAFIVGTQPEGTRGRLATRIALNIYVSLIILVYASEVSYSIRDAMVSSDPPLSAEYMSMGVRYGPISMLLMCIPICSAIDAALEYIQHRSDILTKTTQSTRNKRFDNISIDNLHL